MAPRLSLVVVRATNLDRSQRFYEALGLVFCREKHGNGPEHLAAELPGAIFEIYPQGGADPTSNTRIGFQVKSVAEAIQAVEALGSQVASTPKEGPWGLRAVVIDPDGRRVELTQ